MVYLPTQVIMGVNVGKYIFHAWLHGACLEWHINDIRDVVSIYNGFSFHGICHNILMECTICTVTTFKFLEGGPDREAPEVV